MVFFNVYMVIGLFFVLGFVILLDSFNKLSNLINKENYTTAQLSALDHANRVVGSITSAPLINYVGFLIMIMLIWPAFLLVFIFPQLIIKK